MLPSKPPRSTRVSDDAIGMVHRLAPGMVHLVAVIVLLVPLEGDLRHRGKSIREIVQQTPTHRIGLAGGAVCVDQTPGLGGLACPSGELHPQLLRLFRFGDRHGLLVESLVEFLFTHDPEMIDRDDEDIDDLTGLAVFGLGDEPLHHGLLGTSQIMAVDVLFAW